jgi:hypothetical protein
VCCEGFDAVNDCLEADRAEEVERVLGAGQLGVDDRFGGGAAGSLRQHASALWRGESVPVAMDDKKRRRAALDVVKRRGGQRLAAGNAAVVAVERDDRCDGRVGLFEPRLKTGSFVVKPASVARRAPNELPASTIRPPWR